MRIGKKGFTLVEVIVSLAIMTIVAGSIGAFIIAGNNSYLRGNKELTLQEEAQLAANQMIDLIIDVEKDINFTPDHQGTAVAIDGTTAKDAVGNEITTAHVSELRLVNNESSYMIRWQGTAAGDYATANQVYLYEVENTTDADGNLVVGDFTTATPALMAEHVSSFSVDLSQVESKRKVILNMTFTYQDKSYEIAETIKLRNDLEKTGTKYAWISGLTIDPTNVTLQQGKIQQFRYHLSGDAEAVAEGVTWSVAYASGAACKSTINQDGILQVHDDETAGTDVLVVKCTANADNNMVAYAYVTVEERLIDSITINPKDAEVVRGRTQAFECTLTGKDSAVAQGVKWKVTYADGTTTTFSTMPDTKELLNTLTVGKSESIGVKVLKVTCMANADTSMSDSAYVTVTAVSGQFQAELIRNVVKPYSYTENGVTRMGWSVELECLTAWADYDVYPQIVNWEVLEDGVPTPRGYSFEDTNPSSRYKQMLYCSSNINKTITVRATVKLSDSITVTPMVTVDIPNLLTVSSSKEPYIDGGQFVLSRNGMVTCTLKNYSGDMSKVTWKITNDIAEGLAQSNPTKDNFGGEVGLSRRVGFSRNITSDGLGDYEQDLVIDKSVTGFTDSDVDYSGTRSLFPTATGETVGVYAKWYINWREEHVLTLAAFDENDNEIASTYLLIPRCTFYFSDGNRYFNMNKSDYKTDSGWQNGVYDKYVYVDLYGFDTGQGAFGTGDKGLKITGNLVAGGTDSLSSGTYIDSNIHCYSRKNPEGKQVFSYLIHLYIDREEKNDTLFVNFSDSRVQGDTGVEDGHVSYQKPERALTIFWR